MGMHGRGGCLLLVLGAPVGLRLHSICCVCALHMLCSMRTAYCCVVHSAVEQCIREPQELMEDLGSVDLSNCHNCSEQCPERLTC
jgi:hypothetical protein